MDHKQKEHYQIQFERQNSKYNRLWNQLSGLALFFIGTLFILITRFVDVFESGNEIKVTISFYMIVSLAAFCGGAGLKIISEMEEVKPNIDGILYIFDRMAFKNRNKK